MAQQKIELRKVRDFSDNLNDTFLFIKQNFKPMLTYVFGIAGLFMLTAAILNGMYQSQSAGIFRDVFSGKRSGGNFEIFSGLYFFIILFSWLTATALQVVVIAYMKLYEEKDKETPLFDEVWSLFRRNFLTIALYNIPIVLLMLIGTILCVAPGVYLAVVLAVFAPVVMMEAESFSGAFNRCFTLIKENFWQSLGIYIVIAIVSSFGSGAISLVVGIITGIMAYFSTDNITYTVGIVTSILNVLGFVFYLLIFVAVTLNYYNLVERYDGTGMVRKLQGLGTNQSPTTYHPNTEEEY